MTKLSSYDYDAMEQGIEDLLNGHNLPDRDEQDLTQILYGIENNHRMHWIEDDVPGAVQLLEKYNLIIYAP